MSLRLRRNSGRRPIRHVDVCLESVSPVMYVALIIYFDKINNNNVYI